MPRKKKKEKINIKSSETQIFFGLVLFVLGVALILTPFVKEQADIFVFISTLLGWPAMVWGIAVTAMSINLLTQGKSFSKVSQILGFVVLAFSLNTLLTFWVPVDSLEDISTLQRAGGTVGQFLHVGLNDAIGDVLELIVLLIVLIVAFSFITGIELKQITEVIRQLFTKISLKDLQDKIGTGVGDEKMVISGMDDDNELTGRDINQQDDDIQIQENMSHQKEENLFSQNVRENNSQQPLIKNQSTGTTDIGPATPKYTEWVYPSIDNLQEPKKTER